MSKIKLDLSKFSHVDSDKKRTLLRHKDGHILQIAHDKLSPDFKAQLESLGTSAKQTEQKIDRQEAKQDKRVSEMAGGGEVRQGYEDGGEVSVPSALAPTPPKDENVPYIPPEDPLATHGPGYYPEYADIDRPGLVPGTIRGKFVPAPLQTVGGVPSSLSKAPTELEALNMPGTEELQKSLMKGVPSAQTPITIPGTTLGKPQFQEPGAGMPGAQKPDYNAIAQAAAGPPPQPDKPDTWNKLPSYEDALNIWNKQAQIAIQKQLQADKEFALGKENAYQENQSRLADIHNKYVGSLDELNNERKNFIKDIQSNLIDPEKYWTGDENGNGSHSRLMAGIGMIIAGFRPGSSPNAAIDYVNKQIDNNISAQAKNLDTRNNLLKANLEHFRNLRDATDMTKAMSLDMATNAVNLAAAKAGTPQAQAAAARATADWAKQASDLSMQVSMRQMLMGLNGGKGQSGNINATLNYMDMIKPGSAKHYRDRYVEGFHGIDGGAFAQQEIPERVRQEFGNMATFENALKDLQNLVQNHPITMPLSQVKTLAEQKARTVQAYARDSLLGTVYREGEQPLLDEFIAADPTSITEFFRTPTKIRGLMEANDLKRKASARVYGLAPNESLPRASVRAPVSKEGAAMWLKQNPNHPKAAEVRKYLGE